MASIIWVGVFGILCVELFVLTILCAPLPWGIRKVIARFISTNRIAQKFRTMMYYLIFGVALAIADAATTIRKLESRQAESTDDKGAALNDVIGGTMTIERLKSSKFRAQRNLYLAGFVLTLLFAIKRIVDLVNNEILLRDEINRLSGSETIIGTPLQKNPTPSIKATEPTDPKQKKTQ